MMTENFEKVVKMAQLMEEYKEELIVERKAKEKALQEKEKERKTKEKYRQLLLKHGISPDEEE